VTGDAGRLVPFVGDTLGYVAPNLVLGVVMVFFGPLLRIPSRVQDLSPYHHLALVPAEPFRWAPFVILLVLAAALSALGQVTFARRDVQ
jgi:ABC-2 type transport system permease protein